MFQHRRICGVAHLQRKRSQGHDLLGLPGFRTYYGEWAVSGPNGFLIPIDAADAHEQRVLCQKACHITLQRALRQVGPFLRGVACYMDIGIAARARYTKYTWNPAYKGVDDYLLSCAAGA